MEKIYKVMSLLACSAMITLGAATANAQLIDGGFETTGLPNWSTFNSAIQLATSGMASANKTDPDGGGFVLKVYGPFNSNWDGAGAQQAIAASPGQSLTLTGYGMNPSGDAMGTGSFGLIQIQFQDSSHASLGSAFSSANLASGAPTDVWTLMTATGVAPAGTAFANIVALHLSSPSNAGGSIYFDDLQVSVVPEPSSIALALVGLLGFVTVLRRRRA
jgi:hypothetical protein